MITYDCKKTIARMSQKLNFFDSADQACKQIKGLTEKMAVIRSVHKKVDCSTDAKCYVQSFHSLYKVFVC